MENKDHEKRKAKILLDLVEQYTKASDKRDVNKKLNQLTEELYYKNRSSLSQKMIDVALSIHSFTQAASSGGHYQDLTEFIPDLREIIIEG